jgi:rhodanese-related sulfurtransferase
MRRVDISGKDAPEPASYLRAMRIALRDATIVTVVCTAIAISFNTLRRDGIALIQRQGYQILVPCPVTEGEVEALGPESLKPDDPRTLFIDARDAAEYKRWHQNGAMSVRFDYLEPTDPAIVNKIASSGAKKVVVYGDGNDPDTGEQLAKEIAGKGIRNVAFISGGVATLRKAQAKGTTP